MQGVWIVYCRSVLTSRKTRPIPISALSRLIIFIFIVWILIILKLRRPGQIKYDDIIVNDDQQDATILAYLFIANQLYMFPAMSSPIIRSTWLYLQLLILSTDIAAEWCHGWDGTVSSISSMTQAGSKAVDNIRSCKYSQLLLIMGEDIAGNM